MTDTPNMGFTEMEQSQSQKHVTFNEALYELDATMHISVIDRDLNTPPGSPTEGDRYIVASGGTGDWSGADDDLAAYQNGAWVIFTPNAGWKAYVEDEGVTIGFDGSSWAVEGGATSTSANGGSTGIEAVEEHLTSLSGASVTSTISFPNQCIILGVSVRVTTSITGATSFDCGDGSTANRFGGSLGIASGSTNQGLIGPSGNYSTTTVTLTANGSNFTGGDVRICLHYISTTPPQS